MPPTAQHAVTISAATHRVTLSSCHYLVTAWARDHFGSWWTTSAEHPPYAGPLVEADVCPVEADELTQDVLACRHESTRYAGASMIYRRTPGDVLLAAQPGEQVAYRYEPGGPLQIFGHDALPVALAAARLVRERIRGQLLADGWSMLHASAVTDPDGRTVLALGPEGAGKTTVALLLARAGWSLLATDRVFVRRSGFRVRVLPWPTAASVGVGLLNSLGLYAAVADRVQGGDVLDPTQDQRVTDALLSGSRTPVRTARGTELRVRFHPGQLADWLGLTLATQGQATRLLFPTLTPDTTPAVRDEDPQLTPAHFVTRDTESRYPDVFELLPPAGGEQYTDQTAAALRLLPCQALALSHDSDANSSLLTKVTA
ncbi:hypothetical protein [Streptomyces sp. cg36]|uniref:hypothetical protein n=1 Tax=Streptomyces sp. cg36 TaxID=3238798 RepID=UPI0034E294CB